MSDLNNNGILEVPIDPFADGAEYTEAIQEEHYYPFGLKMEGIDIVEPQEPKNPYTYNGKEFVEDLGLSDYGARWYDPAIGRWNAVDPLASDFPSVSSYSYVFNNPIRLTDPDGMAPNGPIYGENGKITGYLVEAGQGPTQIAQDLNAFYGCKLTCEVTFTDIVNENESAFKNVFDGDGEINDKYNGDYKEGNIKEGDVLTISQGKEPVDTEKLDQELKQEFKTRDSLIEYVEGKEKWLDNTNRQIEEYGKRGGNRFADGDAGALGANAVTLPIHTSDTARANEGKRQTEARIDSIKKLYPNQ